MISEKEQERIRLLSDTELYPQAVEFMQSIAGTLPSSQINGLLNVTLANTYQHLEEFIRHQYTRSTWKAQERHIPDFYHKLENKLKGIERSIAAITKERQEKPSREEQQTLKMLLAREFIQHVLAENAYKGTQRVAQSQPPQAAYQQRPNGRPQGNNSGSTTR